MHRLTATEARELMDKAELREFSLVELKLLDILAAAMTGRYKVSCYPGSFRQEEYSHLADELKDMGYDVYVDEDTESWHISWDKPCATNEVYVNDAFRMKYLTDLMVMDGCRSGLLDFMLARIGYVAESWSDGLELTVAFDKCARSVKGSLIPTGEEVSDMINTLRELGYSADIEDDGRLSVSW